MTRKYFAFCAKSYREFGGKEAAKIAAVIGKTENKERKKKQGRAFPEIRGCSFLMRQEKSQNATY